MKPYYGPPLEIFNRAGAPDISSMDGAERRRLVDRMADGTWSNADLGQKSFYLSRHRVLGEALKFAHEQSLIGPSGRLVEDLRAETREQVAARSVKEAAERARAWLRDHGFPGDLSEARQDKASLLAIEGSLTAKSMLTKLPEAEAMGQLATGYRAYLEAARSQAQSALAKADRELKIIEQRGEEISAMIEAQQAKAQPPTDPA